MPVFAPAAEVNVPPLIFTTPTEPEPPAPIVMRLVFTAILPPVWFKTARSLFKPTTSQFPVVIAPPLMESEPYAPTPLPMWNSLVVLITPESIRTKPLLPLVAPTAKLGGGGLVEVGRAHVCT